MGKLRHVVALILVALMLATPTVAQALPSSSNVQAAALPKFSSTPTPVIVGHASVGTTLSVTVGNWIPAPDTTDIKWMVGTTVVSDTTSYTVQSSDRGKAITVSVTGSAAGYQSATKTSAKATATGVLSSSADPQIASIVHQGDVLTAVIPTFDPTPATVKYQWYRAGVAISGATKITYTSVAADLNKALTFKVTATLPSYDTLTLTSNASEPVVLNGFGLTNSPTLSNTSPVFGNVITGSVVAWSPIATSLSYQWFRDTTAIAGATKIAYTAAVADIGHTLKLRVVGAKTNYTTTTLYSGPTDVVVAATLAYSAAPVITGQAAQGKKLTANPGVWTPRTTKLTYRWMRDGVPISGATASAYTLALADIGTKTSVEVTATLAGHTPIVQVSPETDTVTGIFTKVIKPTISGILELGNTLTANTGTWTPAAESYDFEWYRSGVMIDGENSQTYVLTEDDFGSSITVKVTGHRLNVAPASIAAAALTTWAVTRGGLSATDLYNACSNVGDSYWPCDVTNGKFWLYSDGSSGMTTSYSFSLPKNVYKWRVTFNGVTKPKSYATFSWYAVDPEDSSSWDVSGSISGTIPSAGTTRQMPWSSLSSSGTVQFELWSSDYASMFITSATIEYYADNREVATDNTDDSDY